MTGGLMLFRIDINWFIRGFKFRNVKRKSIFVESFRIWAIYAQFSVK